MRKSEMLEFKWENINLEDGYISVDETNNDESGHIAINKMLNEVLNSVKYTSPKKNVFLNENKGERRKDGVHNTKGSINSRKH